MNFVVRIEIKIHEKMSGFNDIAIGLRFWQLSKTERSVKRFIMSL